MIKLISVWKENLKENYELFSLLIPLIAMFFTITCLFKNQFFVEWECFHDCFLQGSIIDSSNLNDKRIENSKGNAKC